MSQPKVVAIIQARMGSSRLPGKVLLPVGSQPMLARVLARTQRAKSLDLTAVATTSEVIDDPIADFCAAQAIPFFRGNSFDVLDRYYQAALHFAADVIVRITADCPMIDPAEVDRVVAAFAESGADFAANRLPPPFIRTSPIGMDVEVCRFSALQQAWEQADAPYEREHVMPYLYDQPGRFSVKLVERQPSLGHLRFTVDTAEDLKLANAVYAAFDDRDDFTLEDLLRENERHPEWQTLVAEVQHKSLFDVDSRAAQPAAPNQTESRPLMPEHTPKSEPDCPLCGHTQARLFQEVRSFDFSVRYYICERCGFVFQNSAEAQAADPSFYAETYRRIYQASAEPTAKDLRQQALRAADQVRYLRQVLPSHPRRVLDVGSSSGILLEALRDAFAAEAVGVEPGDAYRALAERKGLRVAASLEALSEQDGKFDLITMMHVLEHLSQPLETLTAIRERLLNEGGMLLLEVPNLYAHDSFELAHLSCFTRHTLTQMLLQAGFRLRQMRSHGYPRSETLPLYISALAEPVPSVTPAGTVVPEKVVALKRRLGMTRRKILEHLAPKRTWLPLEE